MLAVDEFWGDTSTSEAQRGAGFTSLCNPLGLAMAGPAQHLVQALLAALLETPTTWQIPADFRAAFGGLFYPQTVASLCSDF